MKFRVFVQSPLKVSGTRPFSCPSTLREFAMTLAASAVRVAGAAVVGPPAAVERTVGQKTVPMFGCFAKIEVEQIKKIR